VKLVSARTALEGLDRARLERPDLVLLDLVLPDLAGEEVLARLRGDPRTAGVPVVVLSANARPERAKQLLEAGAAAYLTKPLEIDRLIELLESGPQ
jgi:CheY-like chemotaxis protein